MICTLTIARYPKYFGWIGILSMAIFHVPLFLNKQISFYKLMGCGKNGTFDKTPDWRQWAFLVVDSCNLLVDSAETTNHNLQVSNFINSWFKFFNAEVFTIFLTPILIRLNFFV